MKITNTVRFRPLINNIQIKNKPEGPVGELKFLLSVKGKCS